MANFILKTAEIERNVNIDWVNRIDEQNSLIEKEIHSSSEELIITLEFASNGNTSVISNDSILKKIRELLNELQP